jgi:hypothetical protein
MARGARAQVRGTVVPRGAGCGGEGGGRDESMDNRRAYMPFLYGRWDDAAQAHADAGISERSRPVRDGFRAAGAFNPPKTREAVSRLDAPVLIYAGELDAAPTSQTAAAGASLFPTPR